MPFFHLNDHVPDLLHLLKSIRFNLGIRLDLPGYKYNAISRLTIGSMLLSKLIIIIVFKSMPRYMPYI